MASASVNLTIPDPCSQSWQAMTLDKQGRFCAHCQKTVVDFTTLTDAQVLAFLNTTSGASGCGRFRTDQLNRVLTAPAARKPGRWHWLGVLLSGWLSSQVVQAQSGTVPGKHPSTAFLPVLTIPDQTVPDTAQPTSLTITGRVVDAGTRKPIPGANVVIKNTVYSVTTDSAGAFRLEFPDYSPDSTVWAVTSSIGYSTSQYRVIVGQPQLFAISEDIHLISESISAGGYVIQKPTLRQRIRNRVKR